MNARKIAKSALAVALLAMLGACSKPGTAPAWEGSVAMTQEMGHYQPQPYHQDALVRAHDVLTHGAALQARDLDEATVQAVRDAFLANLGKGRWLHGEDLATLTEKQRLEQWERALAGVDLTIVQQVGALVRQRQKTWQAKHGTDAAGPGVGMSLPNAQAWQQAFGSWVPEEGGSPLRLLDMDLTIQVLLASWAEQFDAHTALVPPNVSQVYVESATGIAEGLGLELTLKDGALEVTSVLADGPAEKSRLIRPGDVVLAARMANGSWTPLRDVLEALAFFRQDTDWFEVRVRREGRVEAVRLAPATYPNNADQLRVTSETLQTANGPIQALRLEVRFFYEGNGQGRSLVEEARQALLDARTHPQAPALVIVDMRQARGGAIPEAVAFVGLFANQASVGTIRTGPTSFQAMTTPRQDTAWTGPVQVWVGPLTASSAEVAAQAIGDSAAQSEILGWPTYGKGTLQRRVEMDMEAARRQKPSRLGELWVTVGELYGPSGRSLQQRGVALDWTLANPVAEPWGERALKRAMAPGAELTGAKAARTPEVVGPTDLQPALPDPQAMPGLRQAAAAVWEKTAGAAAR